MSQNIIGEPNTRSVNCQVSYHSHSSSFSSSSMKQARAGKQKENTDKDHAHQSRWRSIKKHPPVAA
jgi:hypothetical protein